MSRSGRGVDSGSTGPERAAHETGSTPRVATFASRLFWIPVGLLCVGIGFLGVILPLLPSTVFFVAAAAAFAKSSPRLEAWLLDLPLVGRLVRDYRAGLGMPMRAKVTAISMLCAAVLLSAWRIDLGWVRLVVLLAGLVGVVVILRVPTQREPADDGAAGRSAGMAPVDDPGPRPRD